MHTVERAQLETELAATREELGRSEARFRDVIEGMADAVVAVDPGGVVRFANRRAISLFGGRQDRLVGSSFGHPMTAGESTEIDVVRKGHPPLVMEMRVVESEWEGRPVCLATLRDVTARKEAEADARRLIREQAARSAAEAAARRFRFLAESTSVLSSTLDYEATIAGLARLCVSELADWTIIYGVDANGQVHPLEAAHRDPSKSALVGELRCSFIDPAGPHPVLSVLRSGRPSLATEVTPDRLERLARDRHHLELLRELGVASFILVPLTARGRSLGAIALVSADPARRYGPTDLELAEELASRAALAADNARLYHEAQEATQTKTDLLAVISHDLRTPLNSIIGYAELLSLGVPEPLSEGSRERVERIRAGARHLLELINQLLALSRLEAGREVTRVEEAELGVLVREVAMIMEPLADERGIGLRVDTPPEPVRVRTDPEKLRQVLTNLAANAVKFTGAGDVRLELAAGPEGGAVLRVTDTGPGIAPDDLERIFEPFWRGDAGRGGVAGTGLGLAVVRRLVELLGGRIDVASEVGTGSTFTVSIGAAPPHAPPPLCAPPASSSSEPAYGSASGPAYGSASGQAAGGPAGRDGGAGRYDAELATMEGRFRELIQNTADGVMVVDGGGVIRFANRSAEALFRAGAGELVGRSFGFPIVADETTEIDIVRGRGAAGAPHVAELRVVESVWDDEPAYIVSLRDITDRREAEARSRELIRAQAARASAEEAARRSEFLYEAGRRFAGSLDLASTLRSVVELIVSEFADVCTLDVQVDGRVKRLAGTRTDVPPEVARAARKAGEYPLDPGGATPQARVYREREPLLVEEVTDAWLRQATVSTQHLEAARGVGARSLVCVPLATARDCLGVLTAARRGEPAFTGADLLTAAELGRRAALAIDQARVYRDLEAVSRVKTDFLAVISHELRTPLSAIMGYVGLMERGIGGPPQESHTRFLDRIRASSADLLRIIDEILAFVDADAGRSPPRAEPTTLGALADAAAAIAEPLARDAGLDFHVVVEAPHQAIETDGRKVQQILMNLLSNAIKFTPAGRVELRAGMDGDDAVFAVRDTGVGIPEGQRKAVFEQFWQIENPLTRRVGGTGLGLTVADRLAGLLGGRIELESREGEGSTFTLRVPARASDGSFPAAAPPRML